MKKTMLTILSLLLALFLALPALAEGDTFAFDKAVTELFEGGTLATVLIREGASAQGDVTYTTSAPKIATVDDNGVVTGVSKGTATITAKAGSYKATVKLTVLRPVTEITLDMEKLTVFEQHDPALAGIIHVDEEDLRPIIVLRKGKTATLTLTVAPSSANDRKVTVATSDEEIVRVKEKTLTARETGECEVVVASVQNPEVACAYRVLVVEPVTSVKLTADEKSVYIGDSLTLTATVKPNDATLPALLWTSSKEDVAYVDQNGVVTGLEKGTTTIKAESRDGSERVASFSVTVLQQATDIELDASDVTVNVGSSKTLKATVLPANASSKKVVWSSSDESVAKVSSGKITPVAPGECVITCHSSDFPNVSASCVVTVQQPVKSVAFDGSTATVSMGESLQLVWTVSPATATNPDVTFSSSKEGVATVDQGGVVYGVAKGTATITVASTDGTNRKDTIQLTVTQPAEDISLSDTDITVNIGSTKTLKATVLPTSTNNKKVKWVSSNEAIAKVSGEGKITPVAPGVCTITCISQDNSDVTAVCLVTVQQPVTKVAFEGSSATVSKGETLQLYWTTEPSYATDPSVVFSSSKESVASVDQNGVVYGLTKGTATITVTAADGSNRKDTIQITVTQPVEGMTLSDTTATVNVGSSKTLKPNILPSNANNKKVSWISSNESVARINASGKITPVAPGVCTITCISQDNPGVTATCVVTILQPATRVTLSDSAVSFDVGSYTQLYWTVEPYNVSNPAVTFSSSNERIATVDQNGRVFGVKRGTATITVTAADGSGRKDTIQVHVLQPVLGVHMEEDLLRVGVDESIRLNAVLEPSDASNTNMTWTSSDPYVASVRGTNNRPSVTGLRWGTAIITGVTEDGGYTTFAVVDVGDYDRALRVTDLYLSNNQIKLSTLNESNLTITRFNMIIETYDIFDMPLPSTTLGTHTFVAGNAYTLLPNEITRHGSYYFYDFIQPIPSIGRVVVYITDYVTDDGYTHFIQEDKLEKIEFISPLYIGPEGLLPTPTETPLPTPVG